MKFVSIALVVFIQLGVLASCAKKGVKEKEPNNSFSTASPVATDALYLGFMDSPADRDFYSFTVSGRGVADIQLSGVKGINCAFKAWKGDEEPKLVKLVDDNRKSSPERMANLSVSPGTWYLEIFQSDRDPKKLNTEIPYELTLKMRDAISEESEPNDSMEDADAFSHDGEITGYYSPAYNRLNEDRENLHREEDWFMLDIPLKAGESRLLDLSLSGVTGINAVLALYDSEGNLLAESDNGGPDEPEAISGAGIQKTGSYYVMVAAKGYTASHDEPYRLAAVLKEHDSGAEIEPNGGFDACNVIQNNLITGRVNSKDDADMFRYEAKEGTALFSIEVRPPEEMDAVLTIYGADRQKALDINTGGRGRKEAYPNFYAEGDFYIAVTAKTGGKLPAGEYLLAVAPVRDPENQEREPNNDIALASQIKKRTIAGYTSFRGDKDFFRLMYEARVKERFEVTGPKGGAIRVSITDPLGYIIKSVDVSGDNKMIFSEMIDKKGFIIVESITEDYDNPYTIILRGAQ